MPLHPSPVLSEVRQVILDSNLAVDDWLATAASGLLASVIIKMDGIGNLSGWRWIFILEGIATIIIAIIAWLTMPADLQSAKFFTHEERNFVSE